MTDASSAASSCAPTMTATCVERAVLTDLRELAAALRADGHTDSTSPVVQAEFVTNATCGNGVLWDLGSVYLTHADGAETVADWEETSLEDSLARHAHAVRPVHNANLTVDLNTGTFEVTGPWAI